MSISGWHYSHRVADPARQRVFLAMRCYQYPHGNSPQLIRRPPWKNTYKYGDGSMDGSPGYSVSWNRLAFFKFFILRILRLKVSLLCHKPTTIYTTWKKDLQPPYLEHKMST